MRAAKPPPPARGARAHAAPDWNAAKERLEEALRHSDRAEDLAGLGEALFWLGDLPGAVEARERAHAVYRDEGDPAGAARMAMWLTTQHGALGNTAVASGW